MTGESEPQDRKAVLTGEQGRAVEANNLAFNSTLCVAGEAFGIVGTTAGLICRDAADSRRAVRTGDRTYIGTIAGLTGGEATNKTPLAIEIDHFVHIIAGVAIFTAIVCRRASKPCTC